MAAFGRHHKRGAAAAGRGIFFVVSFVVAMNRVDVVELFVDLDVDLVDVDLAVSLCDGPRSVLFSFGLVAPTCSRHFLDMFRTCFGHFPDIF